MDKLRSLISIIIC